MIDASETVTEKEKLKSERRYVIYQAKKIFGNIDNILKNPVAIDAENCEILRAC